MAIEIKAIKCPHCGSVEKEELKEDTYRCKNCNTDYFLDNDDVNVIITNKNEPVKKKFNLAKFLKIYLIGIIVLIALGFIIDLFDSSQNQSRNNEITKQHLQDKQKRDAQRKQQQALADEKRQAKEAKEKQEKQEKLEKLKTQYTSNYHNQVFRLITRPNGDIFALTISKREYAYNPEERNDYFFIIFDLIQNKIIKEEKLNIPYKTPDSFTSSSAWAADIFDNGDLYAIYYSDPSMIFKIDEQELSITDVTDSILPQTPEFNSGIAKIRLITYPSDEQHSFNIQTNNGQEYTYFPEYKRLFPAFSSELNSFVSEYRSKKFHANKAENAKIDAQYKKNNFFSILADGKGTYSITNPIKTIIENMVLIDARILYQDKDKILLLNKPTVKQDAAYNILNIDPKNGAIKWVIDSSELTNNIKYINTYKPGYREKHITHSYQDIAPFKDKLLILHGINPVTYTILESSGEFETFRIKDGNFK